MTKLLEATICAGPSGSPGRDEFVAGRQDGDARAAAHRQRADDWRRRRARRRAGPRRVPADSSSLALGEIDAGDADVVARRGTRPRSTMRVALAPRILLDHDRVGAFRASARR